MCRCCGHAYYGKPLSLSSRKGKYRHYAYYRCIGMDAYRFGGQRICENRQVRTDMIEEAVWSDVSALLKEPERIEREYERRLNDEGKRENSSSGQQLAAMIQRVQRGIARLISFHRPPWSPTQEGPTKGAPVTFDLLDRYPLPAAVVVHSVYRRAVNSVT